MTRITRRLIAAIFILGFFCIGPLAIIYARGLRWQSSGAVLKPTGTLIVSSNPSRAQIVLNKQPMAYRTPSTITSLPAQRYAVELILSGYHIWKKNIFINNNEAVFLSKVRLIRNSLPILMSEKNGIPNEHRSARISFLTNKRASETFGLSLLFTDEQKIVPLEDINLSIQNPLFAWSDTRRWAAAADKEVIYIIDTQIGSVKKVNFNKQIMKLAWDNNSNNAIVFAADQNYYRVSNNSFNRLDVPPADRTEEIIDFWLSGSNWLEIRQLKQGGNSRLVIRDKNGSLLFKINLPANDKYEYLGGWENIIVLTTPAKTLYVFRYDSGSLINLLTEAKINNAYIDVNEGTLTYTTDFELWTYHPATNAHDLLTRINTQLDKVSLLNDGTHVIYTTNNEVWAIERDVRDMRNRWLLATFEKINNLSVSPDATSIYISGTIGTRAGLFNIAL